MISFRYSTEKALGVLQRLILSNIYKSLTQNNQNLLVRHESEPVMYILAYDLRNTQIPRSQRKKRQPYPHSKKTD